MLISETVMWLCGDAIPMGRSMWQLFHTTKANAASVRVVRKICVDIRGQLYHQKLLYSFVCVCVCVEKFSHTFRAQNGVSPAVASVLNVQCSKNSSGFLVNDARSYCKSWQTFLPHFWWLSEFCLFFEQDRTVALQEIGSRVTVDFTGIWNREL